MGLVTDLFLDEDRDVARVQKFAAAGARTGASVGSRAGPVGAGVGAGFGGATGFLLGVGFTGVDPTDRRDGGRTGSSADAGGSGDRGGPVTISVTDEGATGEPSE
jgi:hypothetical protein